MEEGIWSKEGRVSIIGNGNGAAQAVAGSTVAVEGKRLDTSHCNPYGSFPCSASDPFPTPSPHDHGAGALAHSLKQPAYGPPDGSQRSSGATNMQFSRISVTSPNPSALAGQQIDAGTDDSDIGDAVTPNLPSSAPGSGKRGRGRPPGSGPRQVLAALGGWFALSAGGNFTPHVVTVAAGEDVASKILSFSQKGPRSICILAANGSVSNVALRPPGPSGATLTYEGRFEILSLSGSFTISIIDGIRSRRGGISVSLAGPDGRVIGGGVAGLLMAASPIQVVVGSFLPNTMKEQKRKPTTDPKSFATDSDTMPVDSQMPQVISGCDVQCTPSTVPPKNFPEVDNGTSNSIPTAAFKVGDWQGLHTARDNNSSPDINISLP